ncbi:MAG: RHS repeat-associated core domain-containing protein [Candidatus Omnitrophota bacterium]
MMKYILLPIILFLLFSYGQAAYAITPPTVEVDAPASASGYITVPINYNSPDDYGVLSVHIAPTGRPGYTPINGAFVRGAGTINLDIDTTWHPDGITTITASIMYNNNTNYHDTDVKTMETYNTPQISLIYPSGIIIREPNTAFNLYYKFPNTTGKGLIRFFPSDNTSTTFYATEIPLNLAIPTEGNLQFTYPTSIWTVGPRTIKIFAEIGACLWGCDSKPNRNTQYVPVTVVNSLPLDKHVPSDKLTTVGEPINVANGAMFTSRADILIPAREIPLELTFNYNSQDDFSGSFGFGWRSNYDISLTEQADGSVIEVDESGVYTIYAKNPDSSYTPSPGKYSVLTKNPDGSFTVTRKHGKKLFFDSYGRLTKIEGRNGNYLNIIRAPNWVISEVRHSDGRSLIFTQNLNGKITQVTDPALRTFKYEYSSSGDLAKTIDPLNNETLFEYDFTHNLTKLTDANNHTLNFEYDPDGRAYHSWQDNNNNEVTLSFDPVNKTTLVSDSRANTTKYEYNDYGLVTKITDPQNKIQTFAWDSNFNKLSYTDQNTHTTSFTYDSRGNLLSIVDALTHPTTFTYTSDFQLLKTVTDTENNTTTYDYDSKGNLTKITDVRAKFITNTYNELGELTSTTNKRNYTTDFTYDNYGNLLTATDGLDNTTSFTYDILGNPTIVVDAKTNPTQFVYNGLNQLTQITYADNSTTTYTYDALGNRLSVSDNAQNTTSYTYNLNNQVTSITNPLTKTVYFEYDTEGNRTKVIDQNLHETTYEYDSLNRLVLERNHLGAARSYEYDPVGNLTARIDFNNIRTAYEYDALNRLTKIIYPVGEVRFEYDSLARRTLMADSLGITRYSYDELSRLTQVDGPQANDTLQYTFDPEGNRESLILPGGKTIQYAYDALNRLTSITDTVTNKAATYTYDKNGNPQNLILPNNLQATYSFDALNRLMSLTNHNQANPEDKISEFRYSYDEAGRRMRVETLDSAIDYTYDNASQLLAVNGDSDYFYEYDPSGNRTRMLKNQVEHLYSYNELNQLTQEVASGPATIAITVTGTVSDVNGIQSLTVNGITPTLNGNNFACQLNLSGGLNTITVLATDSAGNTATTVLNVTYAKDTQILYLYDNNGNLIRRQSAFEDLDLAYDFENRLTRISQGLSPSVRDGSLQSTFKAENRPYPLNGSVPDLNYAYDGEGRRAASINGSDITNYLYDGLDVILELDASGDPLTSYLRNPLAAGGIGGIISAKQGALPENYYLYDGLGSTANLTDAAGVNIQSYSYDAFGNALTQAFLPNTRQFLTKETDPTGFIYFGARYYDPRIGRFITPDPLGMIDGPNMYLYAANNPINVVDLWGLCGQTKQYWPGWINEWNYLEYGNYCGPNHGDPAFQKNPLDQLDAYCFEHDKLWRSGRGEIADMKINAKLWTLSLNPKKWEPAASNSTEAFNYRIKAQTYFTIRSAYLISRNAIKSMISRIKNFMQMIL